ncbi:hypothetical protein PaecuDRAFT_0486 [Paenibacillus curdlanolyticus YK9]|uniref:Uncharacterized protein n=1 Tax=Paenibacillus curdlanolyticus YK9 TaxID=717606 RepID=E0I3W1_9BACL|nr:hypothetical protein PaecuDRAFT_0486 [Paenibacillus curdlanolyticus YK9]
MAMRRRPHPKRTAGITSKDSVKGTRRPVSAIAGC